jgi:hypothetical protein
MSKIVLIVCPSSDLFTTPWGHLECSGAKNAFGYGALSLVTKLAAKNSSMLRGITKLKK